MLTLGDVYCYDRDNDFCKEGTAVVVKDFDGELVLLDTYWATHRLDLTGKTASTFLEQGHRLTEREKATLSFQYNLGDYRDRLPNEDVTAYAPGSVVCVTAQHGNVRFFFVKPEAQRSNEVILGNALKKVQTIEQRVRSAEADLGRARREYDRLRELAEAGEQL